MGIPRYQKKEDIEGEKDVAEALCDCLHLTRYERLEDVADDRNAPFDLLLWKEDELVAIAEVKNRRVASTDYDEVFVSVAKRDKLLKASKSYGVPALFVVRWNDGQVRAIDAEDIGGKVTFNGRTDRPNDPNQQERLILQPISDMDPV
jgi:hypothetical protein